ncbi:SusC/RagA family TonB-linked outer membrane protein [Chitinophaga barathri]|nr:SusC/RagA family TonB-linked outer membrane protein [Chitinophaga barathri]
MRMQLAILIILMTFMNVFSRAVAQTVSLQFNQEKLETVLQAISKQSGYDFNYEVGLLKTAKPVTINIKDKTLKETLEICFKDQPISFQVVAKTVTLKAAEKKSSGSSASGDITIRGQIMDSQGKPLSGVTVKIKGGDIGTITDSDGKFVIDVPNDKAILVISSIGYLQIQQPVKDERFITIRLIEATAQLKEITVSPIQTGYEQIKPERFVGSATVIDSTILQRGVSSDLISRLDGVTNGLLFNKAGGALKLQLRGISTINASYDFNDVDISSNPLIILDDFPYQGDLDNINPNDIESVSVLKDAAATSIWGARAGNGVVVITSKKGSTRSRFSVTLNSNIQIQTKPDLDYHHRMNSVDFIDVEQLLFDKGFYNSSLVSPYTFAISPVVELLNKERQGIITAAEAEHEITRLKGVSTIDQYDKYVLRNPVRFQNYLNVSGGNSVSGYNISLGADNNNTAIKGPGKYARYSVNSNVIVKPTRALELSALVNYVTENSTDNSLSTNISPGGRRSALYPYAEFANKQGSHLAIPYGYRLSYVDTVGQGKLLDWHYRPLDEMGFGGNDFKRNFLRLNFSANLKITEWANLDFRYQYSVQNEHNEYLRDERTYFTRNLINNFTNPGTFERNVPIGGILDQNYAEIAGHNVRLQANFRKNWNDVHSFSAIAAAEIGQSRFDGNSNRMYGYNKDVLTVASNINFSQLYPNLPIGASSIPNNMNVVGRSDKFVSVLANANYTYDDRYSIFASARRDGSNLLGVNTNNRWKPLWSIGGRWNINNEDFYHVDWLSNLALRATYGYSGNVNNSISALSILYYSSSLNLFNRNYAQVGSPPNPDLKWEEVRTLNLGLDFGLFKGRISGTFEYYIKKAVDIFTTVPVDPTLGISGNALDRNSGNLETKGFDLAVNTRNLTRAFRWNTTFNLSYARPKVTRYYFNSINTPVTPAAREGSLIGGLYGYKWAGLDGNGDPQGYLGKSISKDYFRIFSDSVENQTYKGSSYPLVYGNLFNTFEFKGVELTFNISFKANYYFRKPTIVYYSLYNSWASHSDFEKRWKAPGDEKVTNVPSMPYPANLFRDQFFQNSEVNLERGDHIRLQDIRLSYNLKNAWKRIPFTSFQIYGYASNLNFLIWKSTDSDYDPDFPTNTLLPLRNYSFGVRIGL